jgi:hypothetical protein
MFKIQGDNFVPHVQNSTTITGQREKKEEKE